MTCDTGTLSSTDITQLATDVKTIKNWVQGGAADSFTLSDGTVVPSPLKVVTDSLMFKGPPIAWAPSLSVTDALQTYSYLGVIYRPNPTALPFTTPGTFLSTNWIVLQDRSVSYDSLYELITNAGKDEDAIYHAKGFYTGVIGGGGPIYWSSTENKANADGVIIIDPDALNGWTGLRSNVETTFHDATFGQGSGVGSGCFIRIYDSISVLDAGAVGDSADSYRAFLAAGSTGEHVFVPVPSVDYELSAVPAGKFYSKDVITLTGAGSGLVIGCDIPTKLSVVASGTDVYTATTGETAYKTGWIYNITFTNAATGSITTTLNLDSLGAKNIKKDGGLAIIAGDIPAGHNGIIRDDGTDFILLNPGTTQPASYTRTITASDDIKTILENAPDDAVITLSNGTYTETAAINITGKKNLRIEAASAGNCFVECNFVFYGSTYCFFDGIDFVAQEGKTPIIARNSLIYLDDCRSLCGVGITPGTSAGFLSASGSTIFVRAVTRTCTFDYSNDATIGLVFRILYGSYLGATPTGSFYNYIKSGASESALQFSSSTGYLHNLRVDGSGKGSGTTCISLIRGSHVRLYKSATPAAGLGAFNATTGLSVATSSTALVEGVTATGTDQYYFSSLTTGITTNGGGKVKYKNCLFSSVDTNTVNDATYTTVE